jgi:hypothetical protein
MKMSRYFVLLTVTASMMVVMPCSAQDSAQSDQATPNLSGTGAVGKIAVWKNSTTLTNSVISQSSGSIGIGTKTPVATLEVNGNAQVDGTFSLSGSIFETGVGQLLWAPNNGSSNVSVGLGALPSTTTGTNNTAVGDSALHANTDGSQNTANGAYALLSNTTGYANTAIGQYTLALNTTGNLNTAIGVGSLYNNTTGINNTASGLDALQGNTQGANNTANGSSALYNNTVGGFNTASGAGALFSNISGESNTAIGEYALGLNTIGGNNIAVGFAAGSNIITYDNIDIGHQGFATDNSTIRIGTPGTQTAAFIAGISGVNISGVPLLVNSSGQLGVASSSRRFKQDIADMGNASDGLMRLRPVTFRYKKAYEDGSKPEQYGLIAEEVAEVYPDLVARSRSRSSCTSIRGSGLAGRRIEGPSAKDQRLDRASFVARGCKGINRIPAMGTAACQIRSFHFPAQEHAL